MSYFSMRFVWVTGLLATFCLPGHAQEKSEFTLVREEDSIFVYERWIIFPGSVPPQEAREVKGDFVVRSTIPEILRLLKDESRIMKWQRHVTEFKVYPSRDTTTWLEYSYHDIPWPVSDQDHFLEYKIKTAYGRNAFVEFKSTVNGKYAPVRKDVSRMNLTGSWTLEEISNSTVRVTYRIISEPSHIPRIFTDPVIRRNLVSTIRALKEILESEEL